MQTLLLLLSISSLAHAEWTGKSSAEFQPPVEKKAAQLLTDNTEFRFHRSMRDLGPGGFAKPDLHQEIRLYQIHKRERIDANVDAEFPQMDVTAIDPTNNGVLWKLEGEYDEFRAHGDRFVVATSRGGDCLTNQRLFSGATGQRLADYSFYRHNDLPLTIITNAFRPEGVRFLAYHDAYWPCGPHPTWKDAPKGLTLAGVLTYASPERVIQKLAVFFVQDDPSDNPDTIQLSSGSKTQKFTRKNETALEYIPPGRAFTGITVKLFWDEDSITLPLTADRLVVAKARGGKQYKVVKEIPEKDWEKY